MTIPSNPDLDPSRKASTEPDPDTRKPDKMEMERLKNMEREKAELERIAHSKDYILGDIWD
ncbi:hypothetical protein FS749_002270 [Ceratobasidium sp. UAMH 11750]|nr:hypothetical protein FS749_002270 [Ceratobasidium sp. UAMH 11750]